MHARLNINLSENPDLAQPLAVTACLLGVPFRFAGLSTLRDKETDRLAALVNELSKLSFDLEIDDDALVWEGYRHPVDADIITIDTYSDHRMAMSFAPVAIYAPGIIVRDVEVVSKSYPDYWNHLVEAGFNLIDPTELVGRKNDEEAEAEEAEE